MANKKPNFLEMEINNDRNLRLEYKNFSKLGISLYEKQNWLRFHLLLDKKKTKAKVLLNNFPVVYLDYGQEKLTEIKKNFDEGE